MTDNFLYYCKGYKVSDSINIFMLQKVTPGKVEPLELYINCTIEWPIPCLKLVPLIPSTKNEKKNCFGS